MEKSKGTESNKELRIGFGALVGTIGKQLKEQGFKYDAKQAKYFDELGKYIIKLMFADILNESDKNKALNKLFNRIKAHVRLRNK